MLLILKEAKLTEEDLNIPDEDEYMVCPLDKTHRVYKSTYREHMASYFFIFVMSSGMFTNTRLIKS